MIDYSEDWFWKLVFRWDGSVGLRAAWFGVPAALLSLALLVLEDYDPSFRESIELADPLSGSAIWASATSALMLLITVRTGRGIARFWEGTGLMHMMRGEWFDTISACVSFSIHAKRKSALMHWKVVQFRHTIVRLMSLLHAYALEEMSGNMIDVEPLDRGGLGAEFAHYIRDLSQTYHFNKVEMVMHVIQSLIVGAHHGGILDVPPPILTRVYQTISRGFVHFLNTKKITDTKFPFPYVQLIVVSLYSHAALAPFVITSLVKFKPMAMFLTFLPLWILAGMNQISIELENPFGDDDNDLPLEHFQLDMDRTMCMLLHPRSDILVKLNEACTCDVDEMMYKFGMRIKKKGGATFRPIKENADRERARKRKQEQRAGNGKNEVSEQDSSSEERPLQDSEKREYKAINASRVYSDEDGLEGSEIGLGLLGHSRTIARSLDPNRTGPVKEDQHTVAGDAGAGDSRGKAVSSVTTTSPRPASKESSSTKNREKRRAGMFKKSGRTSKSMYGQTDFEDYEEYEERMGTQFGFGEAGVNPDALNQLTEFESFEIRGCLKPREGIERFRKFRSPTQDFRLKQQKGNWWGGGGGGGATDEEGGVVGGTLGSLGSGGSRGGSKARTTFQILAKKVRLGVMLSVRGKTTPARDEESGTG